uniref:Cellulose synthase-like protein G3 n=1 Tax=Ananas comosus var. bracteatus TaxID=296719 RepID=A0A6V7NQG0_ANACO|nr:unnamed protein product [Ananas comosus var. bracteatus]
MNTFSSTFIILTTVDFLLVNPHKLRVSGIMSNAPIVLTVDCDMYANDPKSPQRALCYFLDPSLAPKLAFVQFPQHFEGLNKHDIYGGEIRRSFRINSYGLDDSKAPYIGLISSEPTMARVHDMAACDYELRTKWGSTVSGIEKHVKRWLRLVQPLSFFFKNQILNISLQLMYPGRMHLISHKQDHHVYIYFKQLSISGPFSQIIKIGFRYGSLAEDYYTGFRLHCEGWESVFSDPARPAFLGDAPKSLHDSLSQFKRSVVGLFEVAFSRYSPLTFGARNASLAMGLGYGYYAFRGIWCIPILTYALLPQLALVSQRSLFPKASEPRIYLCAYLFLAAYGQDLADFVMSGEVSRGFNVTSKVMEEEQRKRYDNEVFDFGIASPFFILLGTTAILSLASFIAGITRAAVIEQPNWIRSTVYRWEESGDRREEGPEGLALGVLAPTVSRLEESGDRRGKGGSLKGFVESRNRAKESSDWRREYEGT